MEEYSICHYAILGMLFRRARCLVFHQVICPPIPLLNNLNNYSKRGFTLNTFLSNLKFAAFPIKKKGIVMRMWMINPVILCDKHLRGEYVECLMFIGTFKRKLNIPGYVKNNLVEPLSIIDRFYELKNELIRREFNPTKDLDFDI
jgi:hypothetical protein